MTVLTRLIRRIRSVDETPMVPGPRGRWYIGSALEYDADPIGWMTRTREEYGDVVRLDPETIVVHDPELVHEVLAGTNDAFLLDNAMVAGRRGRQTLLDGLPCWMESRRHLSRGLSRSILTSHIGRAGKRLTDTVQRLADREIDLFDEAQRMLGAAIADLCIGADKDIEEVIRAVEQVFWASLEVTDSAESRLPWSPRPIAKRANRLNNELVATLTAVVRRRRAEPRPPEHRDMLDALLDHLHDAPEPLLVAVVRLIMVTSHGPSGATLSWCLLRLAGDPSLLRAVRAEVSRRPAVDDRLPGSDWPITTAVLKESMRMHPPNWLMGRTTNRPVTLGKYRLPADHRVLFSPYMIHRDPRFWRDPERFVPERWLSDDPPYVGKSYLPFGAGPRACPGARLGPVQLALALQAILGNHTLAFPPLDLINPAHSTLLTPANVRGRWTTDLEAGSAPARDAAARRAPS